MTQHRTLPFPASLIQPALSALSRLISPLADFQISQLSPLNLAKRRALRQRRTLMNRIHLPPSRPGWEVILPERLNAPTILRTPQGDFRILHRTLRPSRRTFAFTLSVCKLLALKGFILMCVDPANQEVHLMLVSMAAASDVPYQRFTLEEARSQSELTVSMRSPTAA